MSRAESRGDQCWSSILRNRHRGLLDVPLRTRGCDSDGGRIFPDTTLSSRSLLPTAVISNPRKPTLVASFRRRGLAFAQVRGIEILGIRSSRRCYGQESYDGILESLAHSGLGIP